MENLPLMMSEARRVAKTYSSSTLPKPMNIYGLLNPFFGGPDFEIDEV